MGNRILSNKVFVIATVMILMVLSISTIFLYTHMAERDVDGFRLPDATSSLAKEAAAIGNAYIPFLLTIALMAVISFEQMFAFLVSHRVSCKTYKLILTIGLFFAILPLGMKAYLYMGESEHWLNKTGAVLHSPVILLLYVVAMLALFWLARLVIFSMDHDYQKDFENSKSDRDKFNKMFQEAIRK